jgi:hypothetical protein
LKEKFEVKMGKKAKFISTVKALVRISISEI